MRLAVWGTRNAKQCLTPGTPRVCFLGPGDPGGISPGYHPMTTRGKKPQRLNCRSGSGLFMESYILPTWGLRAWRLSETEQTLTGSAGRGGALESRDSGSVAAHQYPVYGRRLPCAVVAKLLFSPSRISSLSRLGRWNGIGCVDGGGRRSDLCERKLFAWISFY